MKTFIIYTILVWSLAINAQQPLDTIFANDQMNVALFFPNQIRQGITGKDNFVFTYNREKEQYFGLLQAKSGEESNLLIITKDGLVYSYILKYSKQLSKLNYFISEDESIGNEKPKFNDSLYVADTLNNKDKDLYYKKFSEYLLKSKSSSITTKRKKGIVLRLLKMVYHKEEVYLVIEIKNNSGIDFEIDYLNISRVQGNKKRKASYQSLEQEVIYKHDMPKAVVNNNAKRLVYVLPKFVLGENEKLIIQVQELKGRRRITLMTKL
ncbi:DUF4138 domain-containing protein [Mariniflexile aquimaris]|uniref:DUF4138 domain-containing protein n=1 Tax=Mariniflexile aquimaris TaxID=881009 RepID=A0ABW3BWA3_9FLAO